MTRQTKDQFIAEMKKKPQTLGWDVVLAFDRNKINYLLLQDYISRLGAGSLFPPVDSSMVPVTGTAHRLHGLQLDKPRLSFENAVITESRARCLMRTVGGRIIETSRTPGTNRDEAKRLGIADGLVGPVLTMTIHLKNAQGGIGSAGKVELDLSGGGAADFTFSGVDNQFEAVQLGGHLSQEIAKWSDAQKKFQLSELRQNPDDELQPGTFRILTRPAAGATVRSAEDFGDGEVLIMVGLEDRQGSLPTSNTQIPYLLPQGYSSNLVISHDQFFKRMIMNRLEALLKRNLAEFKTETVGGFIRKTATAGRFIQSGSIGGVPEGFGFSYSYSILSFFNSSGPMTVQVNADAVELTWSGQTTEVDASAYWKPPMGSPGGTSYKGKFTSQWSLKHHFKATLDNDPASSRKILSITSVGKELDYSSNIYGAGGDKKCKPLFEERANDYFSMCYASLKFLQNRFEAVSQSVDAFRLNGLLFPNENVVVPGLVALPGDLTILGDLAPGLTGHTLSNDEVVVTAQGTHTFTVAPANSKLTWSVAALPGEPGGEANIGKINANGQYTAPTAASFGFAFRRVVVTATDGAWTGKALVHLVAAPVSVFPLVNVVNLSSADDLGYLVWAASTQGSALSAEVTGNAGGKLVKTDDPDVQSAWRYKAPAEFPNDGTSKLEKVLRVDRVGVLQNFGRAAVCEMILTKTPSQTHFFKHEAVQGGIQFGFWFTDDDNQDVELPNEEVEWTKVSGHGVLDQNGKYTPSTTAADHYVVVAAIDLKGGRSTLWNFKILPLPL
ncbi:hypothetical protein [Pseudomonas sp.]|uniref:hypothetical protein n=1 Tax=Pseudomonas sp. TaxID=306 RepID=UPI0028B08D74|nr:hypothetical protein [Pseudomonas sp.]